jgi:negative elongation factor A
MVTFVMVWDSKAEAVTFFVVEGNESKSLLPLVGVYLNKSALEALVGPEVKPQKHFELRKKMKAHTLKEDLLRKSKLAADAAETKKHTSSSVHAFVGKSRSVPVERQMSEPHPSSRRPLSNQSAPLIPRRSSTLSAPSVPTKPSTIKRDTKIQLIDLSEAPIAGKKRRRDREAETAAKRLDTTAKALAKQRVKDLDPSKASFPPATPHYAAALGVASHSPPSSPQQPAASFVTTSKPVSVTTPAYAVITAATPTVPADKPKTNVEAPAYVPQSVEVSKSKDQPGVVFMTTKAPVGFGGQVLTLTGGQTLAPGTKLVAITNPQQPGIKTAVFQQLPGTSVAQAQVMTNVRAATAVPRVVLTPQPKVDAVVAPKAALSQPEVKAAVAPQPDKPQIVVQPQKKELRLTREQLTMAQEMFKNANRVTRDDKAIILSFMAGSRENPYPDKGELVTVLLNQTEEHVKTEEAEQRIIIEILFEMNYKTGQWRRLQRKRIMQVNPQQQRDS